MLCKLGLHRWKTLWVPYFKPHYKLKFNGRLNWRKLGIYETRYRYCKSCNKKEWG